MAEQPRDRPHLLIQGGGETEIYTSPRLPRTGMPPARARAAHAQKLEQAIGRALAAAREQLSARDDAIASGEPGFYLEFELPKDHQVALDSLGDRRAGVELVAVQPPTEGDPFVTATVFVPEKKAEHFAKKVEQYRDEETAKGNPKHQALVARIEDVRLGALRSLFVDPAHLFPKPGRPAWWEVWVRDGRLEVLRAVAMGMDVTVGSHQGDQISFPERDVVLVRASPEAMDRLAQNSDAIAELRIPKDTPRFFLEMPSIEQEEWAGDLADRAIAPGPLAPAICLLDSGASRDHPLIRPGLAPADQHAYDDDWGVGDSPVWNGHGTMMAGTALYGDLQEVLASGNAVPLSHRLETVKVLPPRGQNDPQLYGAITEIGVGKAEDRAPRRPRVLCMAVTSEVGLGRGRPSSWSAAIDKLAYGGGDNRRLIVLAAGNIRDEIAAAEYPDANDLAEIENPCQAWNALVVGACTDKITITDPNHVGWQPVAPAGDLCPSSRTSTTWDRQWPIRPDVVFEGGNLAHDGANPAFPVNDLQLVTTHYRPPCGCSTPSVTPAPPRRSWRTSLPASWWNGRNFGPRPCAASSSTPPNGRPRCTPGSGPPKQAERRCSAATVGGCRASNGPCGARRTTPRSWSRTRFCPSARRRPRSRPATCTSIASPGRERSWKASERRPSSCASPCPTSSIPIRASADGRGGIGTPLTACASR